MKSWHILFVLLFSGSLFSQNFSDYFETKTLRLDYIFAGNTKQQYAFLDELTLLEGWHGRIKHLSETPIQGNGQIRVYSKQQQLIYVVPFSTLFQEWLTQPDANIQTKSFENSFLLPYPKDKVLIEVVFFTTDRQAITLLKHEVDPNDVLIRKPGFGSISSFITLQQAEISNPIKIAIVAEGYTAVEKELFLQHAQEVVAHLFKHDIFKKYKNAFDIVAVPLISEDTDVSIPSKNLWRKTALQSHFDTFYSERYLTTSRVKNLHQKLENIPYQHVIILANTKTYGGGGILNAYTLTTTGHADFAPVVVHEFGHSFAGLADEYFYASDVFVNKAVAKTEPWEKNITSLADFNSKWRDLIPKSTPIPTPDSLKNTVKIGAFEGLKDNGLYIPTHNCRMKTNKALDFCPVCSRAIEQLILFYTED